MQKLYWNKFNMIKKIFLNKINNITLAATLIAVSSFTSRVLGVFRDRILAGQFGVGDTLDVYYAAFRIPDLMFNLLVLGALSASFVPIFTGLIKKSDFSLDNEKNKDAWLLVNNILNMLVVILLVLSLFGIIFAPYIMKFIVPGFSGEKMLLAIAMTRIMFLSPIFLGVSSILSGVLQSFKRFFIYSLTAIVYNIGIIFGAIFLVPYFGIYGLAYGVIIGSFLHMLIQIPVIFNLGFKYKLIVNWNNKYVKEMRNMMLPRTMTLAVSQINLIIITIFASKLANGSLTVFNFANNLQAFPIGIFGVSFAVAVFPTMSEFSNDNKKLISSFSPVFKKILFFIIPSTVLLIMLRNQIVTIIFNVGKFNLKDTILTANALGIFAVSLFAQATIPLLIRVFYAKYDTKTPFIINSFSVVINIVFIWYFSKFYGIVGLIAGFSLANIINFMLLWITLHIKIGKLDEKNIFVSVIKFVLASILSGITIYVVKIAIWPLMNGIIFNVFWQGLIATLLGLIIYILSCFLMESEEVISIINLITHRKRS